MTLLKPSKLALQDLHGMVASFPEAMRADGGGRTIGLANSIIAHFLGRGWFEKHIRHDAPRRGFLNLDFSSDANREASVFRVVELAENLFNLQNIDGFSACIEQMRFGAEKIESTCAELDFGRFLLIHDVQFRFLERSGSKGADYDYEIVYPDGIRVAAEAKCKFEGTDANPQSVKNSLKKARKQLPDSKPGIIFVKIPQNWFDDPAIMRAIVDIGQEFLRTTRRIVSIKFYVSHLLTINNCVLHRHAFRELSNSDTPFEPNRNWDLFAGYKVPASWNGMPPKWQRLFFFPENAVSAPPLD